MKVVRGSGDLRQVGIGSLWSYYFYLQAREDDMLSC